MKSSSSRTTHDVTLVGPRKQQDARLTLDESGITLHNPHAEKLLSNFQARITSYTAEARSSFWHNAASSPEFSCAASFVSTHNSHLGQIQVKSQTSPDRGSPLGPVSPMASSHHPLLERPDYGSQVEMLPAADKMLPDHSPTASATEDARLIHANQRATFLEEYIARLTAKLSELQHLDDKVAGDTESGQHSGRQDCARLTQRAQLDLEQVQPLLVAYDATIARLQAKLVDRQDEVQKFEQRLEQISGNNAGLLETLKMAVQEAATTAIADATHQPEGNTDRLGLLLRENSLLSKQNAQLDKEVARLQAENDSFSQRCLEASDTAHTASARLRAKEAEVDNMASTLSSLHSKSEELESRLADRDVDKGKLEALAGEALDLRQQIEILHVQRGEALQRAEESAAAAAALRVDVEASREEAEAAMREAAASESAAEELRATTEGLRRTVEEYHAQESDVYASVQEAIEAAEQTSTSGDWRMQHKLARDAAKAREQQLHGEVATLQKQYAEATAQLAASSSVRDVGAATLSVELARARQAAAQHEAEVLQLQATVRRLEKEKRSVEAHMEAVTDSGGCSAEALANLRRALDAERECEAAKLQLEAARRSTQQVRVDEQLRFKKMEAQLEEASRQIHAWSASSVDSKHDVTLLTQQLDTTRHELEAVRTALARTNDIAGTTLASVRSDHVSEVHMLSAQLEETMSAYNRSVAEAEHMMSAKEGILHKYKTEARGAAAKLHACQVAVKEKDMQLAALKQQVSSLDRECQKLRTDLCAAEVVAEEGRIARKRAAQSKTEVAELRSKHEAEGRRRRYAEMELERSKLDANRSRGAKPASLIKTK